MNRLLCLLVVLCSCTSISRRVKEVEWPKFAIGEAVFMVPTTIDELQTLKITALCRETNPIIGECGQNMSVATYFFTAEVLHIAISLVLPPNWRRWWQGLTAGGEAATAWKNHGDGILILPWH